MIRINAERLWSSLEQMASIGALPGGGVRRLAYSKTDYQAREQLVRACSAAGCKVEIDSIGNVFAHRAGAAALPPVQIGSHLDTQPAGGKFDGAFGVLAGLEVLRTLNEHDVVTRHPIELVSWAAEEGARFAPAMLGSAVHSGGLELERALAIADADGVTIDQELDSGGLPVRPVACKPIRAYLEAHIEQGPILDEEGISIGVVNQVAGIRWYDARFTGVAVHAGPFPMSRRCDALVAAAQFVQAVAAAARSERETSRATMGNVSILNPSRNSVPANVTVSVDLRDASEPQLDELESRMRHIAADIAGRSGVTIEIEPVWRMTATAFDRDVLAAIRAAAEMHGFTHRPIMSGAGHDAVNIARVAPAGMIFIPCKNGVSHSEQESAEPRHVANGCQVLFGAALALAGRAR